MKFVALFKGLSQVLICVILFVIIYIAPFWIFLLFAGVVFLKTLLARRDPQGKRQKMNQPDHPEKKIPKSVPYLEAKEMLGGRSLGWLKWMGKLEIIDLPGGRREYTLASLEAEIEWYESAGRLKKFLRNLGGVLSVF